jgi:hypothetical protein
MRTRPIARLVAVALVWSAFACSSDGESPAERTTGAPKGNPAENDTDLCGDDDWCEVDESLVPTALRRPLQLPLVEPGEACPASLGRDYENSEFGGVVLGKPPVQPLIGPNRERDVDAAKTGVLRLRPRGRWHYIKTLWFARPSYQGPTYVRGRQLDGSQRVFFGDDHSLVDPYLSPGPTANTTKGFRQWPGGTWLRAPGCYAWQIDGESFSQVIVFEAEFIPGREKRS